MAKKMSFAAMIDSSVNKAEPTEKVQPKIMTPEDHRNRLMATAEKQFAVGGSQETSKEHLFNEGEFEEFLKELRVFVSGIPEEEVVRSRVYITTDVKADFHINAVRKDGMVMADKFAIILEEEAGREGAFVIRVILNHEKLSEKLKNFFQELDFQGVNPKAVQAVMGNMDVHGGITVRQIRFDRFREQFGARKDWFQFSEDCYGIFEEGELVLTSKHWKRSVSLRMPEDGARPWLYRFSKDAEGFRESASFRVNAYGALWHVAKKN